MTAPVLVVDDSLTVRMDLSEAFEGAGMPVRACATLREARQLLASEPVGLVVLDVMLPDGNGIDLLGELRADAARKSLPVMVLSSEAEVQDRVRALEVGADDYVGKPYDVSYVVSRARQLLAGHDSAGAAQAPVLVVDDSATFREEMSAALRDAGYLVVTAETGEDGLRVAEATRPLAILVDGQMPGIDGPTFIRRVRIDPALQRTPCVLLTASDERGAELTALDAGADAFVRKGEDLECIMMRVASTLRRAAADDRESKTMLGPKRVLVVDDSATWLEDISVLLRSEGYDVVQVHSGEEAIALVTVQSVDCILLDVVMPGLGGLETCRRLKASPLLGDVPLILVTDLDDRAGMLEGLAAGADDYIAKASDEDVLRARVRAQIRRKQLEDESRRVRERLLRVELDAAEERAARQAAETKASHADELARKNQELEAFSYSVSHDLRAPLRAIDGFSRALEEDYAGQLDAKAAGYLARVRSAAQRMDELIDDLLHLSRIGRGELRRAPVDISTLAHHVLDELARKEPARRVEVEITPGLSADADGKLIKVLLENLLDNAWKFTSKTAQPRIEVGASAREGQPVFYVRDNGAGFDMAYAKKLFGPFQRLHTAREFPGTGIGLATVHRIADRHGGRVWAEGTLGKGATISFSIPARSD
jgi:two-component system, NtrC family, sensor kinase